MPGLKSSSDAVPCVAVVAPEHAAVERDAVVGGAEVLLGAVGDRALRAPHRHVLAVDVVHDVFAVGAPERHIIDMDLVEQLRIDL